MSFFWESCLFLVPVEDSKGNESTILFLPCIADRGRRWLLEALPLSVSPCLRLTAPLSRGLAGSPRWSISRQRGASAEAAKRALSSLPASRQANRSKSILQPAAASLRPPGPTARARRNTPANRARANRLLGPASPSSTPRLAQKRDFLCITICITLKFTFSTPLWEGFSPSLLEPGCSAWNLQIFPFHLHFILPVKTSASLRAVSLGGGLLFGWGGGGEHPARGRRGRGSVGSCCGAGTEDPPPGRNDGHGLSSSLSPDPSAAEAGYIFKKPNCKQLWRCQNSLPSDTALRRRIPQAGLFLLFALPSSATIKGFALALGI